MRKRSHINLWTTMFIIILLMPVLTITGCWDRREPDAIGIVIMAAFDWDAETELFRVIAQVANPLGGTGGEEENGGAGERASVWVGEAKGHTIYEAIKNLELITTRSLFWTHLNVIIFTEELAREGIRPVLDYLDRERQSRLITHPFVLQGDARKMLEAQFPLEQVGAQALSKQHRFVLIERSVSPWIDTLRDMFQLLSQPGQELVLASVHFIEENDAAAENDEEMDKNEINPVRVAGAAIFRGDRLVGCFNEWETSGYMLLIGETARSIKVIKCPGDEAKFITVELFDVSSEVTPIIEGEQVRFKLSVFAEGRIQDFTCADLPLEEEFVASMNRQVATVMHNDVEMSLAKAQELETDVFGLGSLLFRTNPEEWRRLADRWHVIFPDLVLDIEIKVIIRRTGLILEPLQIR